MAATAALKSFRNFGALAASVGIDLSRLERPYDTGEPLDDRVAEPQSSFGPDASDQVAVLRADIKEIVGEIRSAGDSNVWGLLFTIVSFLLGPIYDYYTKALLESVTEGPLQ